MSKSKLGGKRTALLAALGVALAAGSRVTGAFRQAAGGDGYPLVTDRIVTRNFVDQDLADYFAANTPITPVIQGRIGCIGLMCPAPLP